jgi:hypothetical protein
MRQQRRPGALASRKRHRLRTAQLARRLNREPTVELDGARLAFLLSLGALPLAGCDAPPSPDRDDEIPRMCAELRAHADACEAAAADAWVEACVDDFRYGGCPSCKPRALDDCDEASEEFFACLSTTDCDALDDDACAPERAQRTLACDGVPERTR